MPLTLGSRQAEPSAIASHLSEKGPARYHPTLARTAQSKWHRAGALVVPHNSLLHPRPNPEGVTLN